MFMLVLFWYSNGVWVVFCVEGFLKGFCDLLWFVREGFEFD